MSKATPETVNLLSKMGIVKVVGSGSGTVTAPSATSSNSPQSNTVTIPNVYGTSDIIVACTATVTFGGLATQRTQAPWVSNDGRKAFDCTWDENNIYIRATSSTVGSSESATTFNYTYNIIMM